MTVQHRLAGLHLLQGNYAQASEGFADALKLLRRQQDHDTTDVLRMMINLGAALAKQGKLDEASAVFEEVVEIQKRLLGPDHPTTLTFTKLLDGLRQGQTEMIQLQPGGPLVPNGS